MLRADALAYPSAALRAMFWRNMRNLLMKRATGMVSGVEKIPVFILYPMYL